MKFFRIFPLIWARTFWPLGSVTRNMVFGKTSVIVPWITSGSSFGILEIVFTNTSFQTRYAGSLKNPIGGNQSWGFIAPSETE
jgi:hypothetical protein